MLDPRLKDYLSLGYAKIGEITYKIALNMRKGKNSTASQRALYEQGIKIYLLLDVLFRHVTFNDDTDAPELWRITETQVNKFVRCLIEVGELDKSPAAPSLYPTATPIRILQGLPGPQGIAGTAGSDADIIATLKVGERRLRLVESVNIDGVKTYEFSYSPYVAPGLTAAVQGSSVWEIGDIIDFNILVTSTKGSAEIVTLVCNDATVNAAFQLLFSLVAANNALAQPYAVTVGVIDRASSFSYLFTTTDEEATVVAGASISFFYPYLYGISDLDTINPYSTLTKILAGEANRSIPFAGTDKYFWVWFPSSYGTLSKIRDQNGFDVTASFTTGVLDVTSTGKDANWTENYRWYRTTVKTTINDTYTIEF